MHSEMQRYPEEIKIIHENIIENTIGLLSDYFKSLQKKGNLRALDCVFAARAFLGMFFSYFYAKEIKECLNLKKEDINTVVDAYVDIFLRGTLKIS